MAVVAVVIFHLDKSWLKGGFLGVDVFFVLSGFLMASVIYPKARAGTFSLSEFWARRIKRLLPAMTAMVAVVLLVGGFVLVPPERILLPQQALAAVGSFMNIYLWRDTGGYWTPASENISLLHTWSLSVEEQFYIFLPICLLLISKLKQRSDIKLLLVICLLSFGLCAFATPYFRSASFYLLPTRMWELLAGSLLGIWRIKHGSQPCNQNAAKMQLLGLVTLLGAFYFVENDAYFPGVIAAIPCFGTLLLIHNADRSSPVTKFLSQAVVVYLGKLSYSIYLWHWPVIVFTKYVSPAPSILLQVGITLSLSIPCYHLVENRIRYSDFRLPIVLLSCLSAALTSALPVLILDRSPLFNRFGDMGSTEAYSTSPDYNAYQKILNYQQGPEANSDDQLTNVLVVGSSHAKAICHPIAVFCEENNLNFESLAVDGVGISENQHEDGILNEKRLKIIEYTKPKLTIIGGLWSNEWNSMDSLKAALMRIAEASDKVLLIGQVPRVQFDKRFGENLRQYLIYCSITGQTPDLEYDRSVPETNNALAQLVSNFNTDNISYLNPHDLFIDENKLPRIQLGEQFLYLDNNHINLNGARILFDALLKGPLKRSK